LTFIVYFDVFHVNDEKFSVNCRLGEKVYARAFEKAKTDVVIIAVGTMPIVPDIPGTRVKNVVNKQETF
jgi:thioredoxin reductase